jgi:uracil-DNA glycosylase family 4
MATFPAPVEAQGCLACPLSTGRTNVVWGFGQVGAKIMLIGEAPGYNEDRQGKPFVGQAGKHLDKLLAQAGISRDHVYITNRVKCRPPQNREPVPKEREECLKWLTQEVNAIKPEVVVLLGRTAASLVFPGNQKMSEMLGKLRAMSIGEHNFLALATYHPAAALRQGELVSSLIVQDLSRALELASSTGEQQ